MSVPDELRRYVPRTDLYDSLELVHYHMPVEQPPATASYIIFKKGNKTYAKNGTYGHIEYENTDPASVIQYAINKLTSGGTILIKAGVYSLSNPISIGKDYRGVTIAGEGASTILKPANADNDVIQIKGTGQGAANEVYYAKILNLKIEGDGTGSGNGVYLSGCHYCWVQGLKIKSIGGCGIKADSEDVGNVDNCFFLDNYIEACGYGIYGRSSANFEENIIRGNEIVGCSNDGIYVRGWRDIIQQNVIEECGRDGIRVYASNGVIIVGNTSSLNIENGIHVITNCQGIAVIGNSVAYNDRNDTASFDGIRLHYNVKHSSVIGNTVFDNDRYEIAVNYGNEDDILIAGNIVTTDGVDHQGTIYIASGATNIRLLDNVGHVTRNWGTATIAAGTSSATVNHGLSSTPSKVLVTPIGDPGDRYWVANVGSASFDIVVATAPSADIDFYWQAEV